jgi:hypothetical protein
MYIISSLNSVYQAFCSSNKQGALVHQGPDGCTYAVLNLPMTDPKLRTSFESFLTVIEESNLSVMGKKGISLSISFPKG